MLATLATTTNQVTPQAAATRLPVPWRRWAVVLIPGALLYFLPIPGFTPVQRHLLAVFLASIIALVAQPVPMGVSLMCALTILGLTRTVSAAKVLSGFSN